MYKKSAMHFQSDCCFASWTFLFFFWRCVFGREPVKPSLCSYRFFVVFFFFFFGSSVPKVRDSAARKLRVFWCFFFLLWFTKQEFREEKNTPKKPPAVSTSVKLSRGCNSFYANHKRKNTEKPSATFFPFAEGEALGMPEADTCFVTVTV